MAIRKPAKPGKGGMSLRANDFKPSRNVLISRQSPNVIWLDKLTMSDPSVKAFARRNKESYPDQRFLDHGDTFDAFTQDLDLDKERKQSGLFESSFVPKKHGEVGRVYPEMLELDDIHSHVLSGEGLPSNSVLPCVSCTNHLRASSSSHTSSCLDSLTECKVWAHFVADDEVEDEYE